MKASSKTSHLLDKKYRFSENSRPKLGKINKDAFLNGSLLLLLLLIWTLPEFITWYLNSTCRCPPWHFALSREKTTRARSLWAIEGHVNVRDSHQVLVFPRGSECGELTIADSFSLVYSCLCDDRKTRETCPAPFTLPPWWMDSWERCSAFTLVVFETTRLTLLQRFSI